MYIGLNQIRAGETLTPEESTRTSAFDRIAAQSERRAGATEATASDGWLCQLSYNPRADAYVPGPELSRTGRRASDRGLLPMKLGDYLELLDWTGRQLSRGKTGKISARLAPILQRIGVAATEAAGWLDLVSNFDKLFTHVVGTSEQLLARAAAAGRRCYRGRANCQAAFGWREANLGVSRIVLAAPVRAGGPSGRQIDPNRGDSVARQVACVVHTPRQEWMNDEFVKLGCLPA